MNKLYVALGGLASLVLLTPGDASASPKDLMGVGPPPAGSVALAVHKTARRSVALAVHKTARRALCQGL